MMPEEDSGSDAEVVALALQNQNVFAVLISRYETKLGRYLRRLGVVRPEDREDVLQDIFIKVYRNLQSYDSGFSFSSWIYRIAHNETMSWFRKRSARPDHTLVDDSDAVFALLSDGKGGVEEAHMTGEDNDAVRDALDTLQPKYRDVLLLRYFEEKSYEEISDILAIPIGTVATLVYRAKERLRQTLQRQHKKI